MYKNRFKLSGACKCVHIKDGSCKQCTACDSCEFYVREYDETLHLSPHEYFWGGEIRDDRSKL